MSLGKKHQGPISGTPGLRKQTKEKPAKGTEKEWAEQSSKSSVSMKKGRVGSG